MSKKEADRFNEFKPKLSYVLLGKAAVTGEARVWTFGAIKYEKGDWLKGAKYTEISDSLLRHLTAFLNGEDYDKESGEAHVHHIQTNAKMLAQAFHTRPDLDDRVKAEESSYE